MMRPAGRIATIYLVVGSLWIVLSDWLLLQLGPVDVALGQTTKGLLFVISTALLIYLLWRREVKAWRLTDAERERLERRLAAAARLESMGQLVGGISHDFNNLLTAISGNIEAYMNQHPANGPGMIELEEARDSAARAAELTRQLLAFGRPRIDRPEPVDANEVIRNMTALLERLIVSSVQIELDLDPELGTVQMDPGRLEQVMMNLAINARDAMPEGGTVRLSTSRARIALGGPRDSGAHVTPGDYVRIDVTDTGVGMTTDLQARIFEPLLTTKPRGMGTGLGLSTVQSLVVAAGGYVSVRSAPGTGSTFTVLLPELQRKRPEPESDGSGSVATKLAMGTERVLVAEDDAAVRSLVVKILRRRGFDVLEATNGMAALDLLRDPGTDLDLLISDVHMPEMDGLVLMAAAKALRPRLGALLISGSPEDGSTTGLPYLAKPFTAAELVARVRAVLDG
jgi:two-component system, cell cycle sensor histidine kinase and response regulator CckA